jgi:hypothetical protein
MAERTGLQYRCHTVYLFSILKSKTLLFYNKEVILQFFVSEPYKMNKTIHKQSFLQLLLFCLTSVSFGVFGQSEKQWEQQEVWTYFYPHIELSGKVNFIGDIGYRIQAIEPEDFNTYFRPSWGYKAHKKLTIMGGVGLFFKNKTESKVEKTEIRPWQGVEVKGSFLGVFKFKHLVRAEERFIYKNKQPEFNSRLRYKLTGKPASLSDSNWNLPFYGELFWPMKKLLKTPYHSQFRSGLGISYSDKNWELQMTYNWHLTTPNAQEALSYQFNSTQIKLTKTWAKKTQKRQLTSML